MWIRSAPARSASRTCSPRRAKSAARIDGAILGSTGSCTRLFLKSMDELSVAVGNLVDRVLPCDLVGTPVYERIPKARTTHSEADESWNLGGCSEPLVHLLIAFIPAEYDATDFVPATLTRRAHDSFAVRLPIKSLDFP